jgi:hypothetical protein
MKRYVSGLAKANASCSDLIEHGLFLVRIVRAQYRWHSQKPFFSILFAVVEPSSRAGKKFSVRLYCSVKALWKLNWFLRDFGYDADLLDRDEIDDKLLIGLTGAVKISHTVVHGSSVLNLDGFAPAEKWPEMVGGSSSRSGNNAKAAS